MDHSYDYLNIYPSGIEMNQDVVHFFEQFFRTSDTPNVHEKYISNFTDDATFILASKVSKGKDEILETRQGMWSAVASRRHTVHKIFPFGNNANEVMLYGHVVYELKSGDNSGKDWAARAVLTKSSEEGRLQLQFYQVYLDTK